MQQLRHSAQRLLAQRCNQSLAWQTLTATRLEATKSGTWIEGPVNLETDLVHAGVSPEVGSGAILTPLFLSTTFVQDSVEDYLKKGFAHKLPDNKGVGAQ